ncbi:MAG: hypothetical protein ABI461_10765 [Polyangiaceae bacterium]
MSGKKLRAARKLVFAIVGAAVCASLVAVVPELSPYGEETAYAQTKRHTKKPKTHESSGFDASAPLTSRSEDSPPAHEGREKKEKDGGGFTVETRGKGDAGSRVFRFGEIDIEGRLRSPQLVYFLRRVRAEFAAGDLGHRSFMRELSDTRHDPNF